MTTQNTEIKIGDVIERKEILKVAKLPHKGDSHLRVVLTKFRDQYVSFLYNMSAPGFHHGRYADTEEEGNKNFENHCDRYEAFQI